LSASLCKISFLCCYSLRFFEAYMCSTLILSASTFCYFSRRLETILSNFKVEADTYFGTGGWYGLLFGEALWTWDSPNPESGIKLLIIVFIFIGRALDKWNYLGWVAVKLCFLLSSDYICWRCSLSNLGIGR
jgi:hypothetical protein